MNITFQKMHGTLNDFVVLHDMDGTITLSSDQVAYICDRRAGVGADGVIVVRPSNKADFFMDYVNSDGSLAEMCGNGIRCLAKYVYDSGLTTKTTLPVETRAGVKLLELSPGQDGRIDSVCVDMGAPIFEPKEIPVNLESQGSPIIDQELSAGSRTFKATILSMGNPHCVIVVDEDPGPLPQTLGPTLETHPLFPAKTNVEFIRILSRDRILMRVWERGSGETLSCGTGACASAVAANLKGLVDALVTVELRGGNLEIEWQGNNNHVLMAGPAITVFEGSLTI
jgi:diaminopimelate epimerase